MLRNPIRNCGHQSLPKPKTLSASHTPSLLAFHFIHALPLPTPPFPSSHLLETPRAQNTVNRPASTLRAPQSHSPPPLPSKKHNKPPLRNLNTKWPKKCQGARWSKSLLRYTPPTNSFSMACRLIFWGPFRQSIQSRRFGRSVMKRRRVVRHKVLVAAR